jgi:hypothetical protein
MNVIKNNFIQGLKTFINEQGGDTTELLDMADYITEASRIADVNKVQPPNLNFSLYYSLEIYKLQKIHTSHPASRHRSVNLTI